MNSKKYPKEAGPFQMIKASLAFMLETAIKQRKAVFIVYLLRFLSDAFSEVKMLLLPKLIVDELMAIKDGALLKAHLDNILIYVGITVIGELLARLFQSSSNSLRAIYDVELSGYFNSILGKKAMSMDFEHTEDPASLEQREKARNGVSWYSGGVMGILDCFYIIVFNLLLLISVITIISVYCPILLPVQIIAMGIVSYFNYKNRMIDKQWFLELSKLNRVFGYVYYELSDFTYGKDIRMYDSVDMMCNRADNYAKDLAGSFKKRAVKSLKNEYGSDIANAIRDGISYFYMGYLAIKGLMTVGDFTMCVSAASRLYNSLLNIATNIQEISQRCAYAYQFLIFLDYPDALVKGSESIKSVDHKIEFKHVYFKYPRASEYVLEDINLTISPKEHLSVVGLNGAGKTTFIKLLCRLYDVTEGEILVDGINIKEYSEEEYRKLFSVVFQDFKLFAFSLKENIMMGDVDKEIPMEEQDKELEKVLGLSGLLEDAKKLDNGYDTLLYKSFDEKGTELSGGQQQKTAISRALYKDAPIVILDEPTAALDPLAEYEIYSKFDVLVGNKAAIYISHRLSSCKFCDKIAVFSDKTIKEYGTHSELLKKENGIYSEMFKTQAQYYVENA